MYDLFNYYILESKGIEWFVVIPLIIMALILTASVIYIIWLLIRKLWAIVTFKQNDDELPLDDINEEVYEIQKTVEETPADIPEGEENLQEEKQKSKSETIIFQDDEQREDPSIKETIDDYVNYSSFLEIPLDKKTDIINKDVITDQETVNAIRTLAGKNISYRQLKREYIYQKLIQCIPFMQPWEQSWLLSEVDNGARRDLNNIRTQYILELIKAINEDNDKASYFFELKNYLLSLQWYRDIVISKNHDDKEETDQEQTPDNKRDKEIAAYYQMEVPVWLILNKYDISDSELRVILYSQKIKTRKKSKKVETVPEHIKATIKLLYQQGKTLTTINKKYPSLGYGVLYKILSNEIKQTHELPTIESN